MHDIRINIANYTYLARIDTINSILESQLVVEPTIPTEKELSKSINKHQRYSGLMFGILNFARGFC